MVQIIAVSAVRVNQ